MPSSAVANPDNPGGTRCRLFTRRQKYVGQRVLSILPLVSSLQQHQQSSNVSRIPSIRAQALLVGVQFDCDHIHSLQRRSALLAITILLFSSFSVGSSLSHQRSPSAWSSKRCCIHMDRRRSRVLRFFFGVSFRRHVRIKSVDFDPAFQGKGFFNDINNVTLLYSTYTPTRLLGKRSWS